MNCAICGNPNPNVPIYSASGDYLKSLCDRCSKIPAQCGLCQKAEICPFENEQINLPKVVIQTIQKGNMTAQIQVKNPERIEETCKKSCPCFSEELGCLKENGICGNYLERGMEASLEE